ncbi:hypothetical protein T4E_5638 [Trichinella pseudospiralis]|uniref:Uncharacterized protein n=1 Tax=Trichinella pseudospiralis TaxID=6337 RepID=A0A0V0Y9B7_TRIPS|nr:hypothetical protein T4E_5638 [Trichinella pseudospiralis]
MHITRERSKQRFEGKPCASAALKTETITDQSANLLLLLLPPPSTPTPPPPLLFNVYHEKSAQLAN